MDLKRKRGCLSSSEKKKDKKMKRIKRIQEEEAKIAKEGVTYSPGAAPLD